MPNLITDKGRAVPSFYGTVKGAGAAVKPKLPFFAILILGGVGVIFILRNKSSSSTKTGPALTLNPSNDSDVSTIDNLTQAVLALGKQGQNGGTTTPTTVKYGSIWGSDVPTAIKDVDPSGTRVAALFKKEGLGYGTVVNPQDLVSAFKKAKVGYGTVVNPQDVAGLLKKEHV